MARTKTPLKRPSKDSEDEYFSDELLNSDDNTEGSHTTPEEAQEARLDLARDIFKYHAALQGILERHESEIRKLWAGKSDDQKRSVLKAGWKDIPAKSRPDLAFWLPKQIIHDKTWKITKHDAFMWPHITVEDLLKSNNFLLLLNSRGRQEPHVFVDADLETVQFGWKTKAIKPNTVSGHTMLLHGKTSADTYGELASFDPEGIPAIDESAVVSRAGTHPGCGLKVLELQRHVVQFLLACCKNILQHLKDNPLAPIQPEPPFVSTTEVTYESLQTTITELPYRVPTVVDFDRLILLAGAECDLREDLIWTLRQDPGIFAQTVEDATSYEANWVIDEWNLRQLKPLKQTTDESDLWNTAIQRTVNATYYNFILYNELVKRITLLKDLSRKHHGSRWPDHQIPSEYAAAYLEVRYLLGTLEHLLSTRLARSITLSPPLQDDIRVIREEGGGQTVYVENRSKDSHHNTTQLFVDLLRLLFTQREYRTRALHVILNEIEQSKKKDPKVQDLINQRVASDISPLLALAEIQQQLYHFQPWTWLAENDLMLHEEQFRQEFEVPTFGDWVMDEAAFKRLHEFGRPERNGFHYPDEAYRTEELANYRRVAEKNLDGFWGYIDQHVRNVAGQTYHDLVADRLTTGRLIQRTPPWTPPSGPNEKPAPKVEYDYIPIPATEHQSQDQSTGSFDRKLKEKTRPVTDPNNLEADQADPAVRNNAVAEPEPEPPHVIVVDRKTHLVVEALFHSPLNGQPPGEITWQDFLNAMRKIGFDITSVGGSGWRFMPDKERTGVERPIIHHAPHGPKLPLTYARNNGQALTRMYGWTAKTFKLEEA